MTHDDDRIREALSGLASGPEDDASGMWSALQPRMISARRRYRAAAAATTALVAFVVFGGVALFASPTETDPFLGPSVTTTTAVIESPTSTIVPTPTTTPVSCGEVSPCPRNEFGMAYDAESDRIILFGGDSEDGWGGDLYDDTWSYDLNTNTWTKMEPAEAPSPRWDFAMAYDAESDRVVLFGGVPQPGALSGETSPGPLSDETWAYDFNTNTWTKMEPVTSPSARGSKMAYDAESDRVVLFGGRPDDFVVDDETWTYDFNSNTWAKMEPVTSPSARSFSGMAYDAESDRVILFGGATDAGASDETWAYDYNTNMWTNMGPAARPFHRHSPYLAYDTESDRVVLFGGHLAVAPEFSEQTWAYDFNTNTWTNMEPPTQPLRRAGNGLAYDAESDRVVLFGGDDHPNYVFSDETWAYDLNTDTWTDMSPTQESQ